MLPFLKPLQGKLLIHRLNTGPSSGEIFNNLCSKGTVLSADSQWFLFLKNSQKMKATRMILPFYVDSTDSSIHPYFTVRTYPGFYLHLQVLTPVQSFCSKRRFCNRWGWRGEAT